MAQRPGDRLAVAGEAVHAEHRVLADQLGEHGPAAIPASGVDGDRLLDRVRLGAERLDESGQQASTVMRHDDRGNGVPGLRVRRQVVQCRSVTMAIPRDGRPEWSALPHRDPENNTARACTRHDYSY